ncbi:MAG TPA: hypothetical protein VFP61_13395 [Acidimicrobiales bacterium]|nr:hypothetical protein [Acidimicrobiales bacterium]
MASALVGGPLARTGEAVVVEVGCGQVRVARARARGPLIPIGVEEAVEHAGGEAWHVIRVDPEPDQRGFEEREVAPASLLLLALALGAALVVGGAGEVDDVDLGVY